MSKFEVTDAMVDEAEDAYNRLSGDEPICYRDAMRAAITAAIEASGLVERFDLVAHLHRQREMSLKNFGPGARTKGVIDHIKKELNEIEEDPTDITEWVDVIILAFDGAWRAGWEPEDIVKAIVAKQTKNEARQWPDWRTADPNKAIEHVRGSHD
jgi:hypothetical protein